MAALPAIPAKGRDTREYTLASGEDYSSGALVVLDGSQEVTECGADPSSVLGVAAHGAEDAIPDGLALVHLATENALFWMSGDADPEESDIGEDYGAVVDSDNIWTVDTADTTNLVFQVVDVDLDRNLYLVRFVADVRQMTP